MRPPMAHDVRKQPRSTAVPVFRIEKVRGSIPLSSTENTRASHLGVHASPVCESLLSPLRKSRDPYPFHADDRVARDRVR
jgi:hypothetical protein